MIVKGRQVVSIGMWGDVISGLKHANPYSIISSKNGEFKYPKCSEFVGKRCLGFYQGDEYANCIDDKNRKVKIRCSRERISSKWKKIEH